MENGYIAREYQKMSPEDRRTFDRWIKANAFIGFIFAAGIIAMAFAGAWLSEPGGAAVAERAKSPDTGSERQVSRSGLRNVQYPSR
ncbi:MAG: hypothetical protein QOJ58_2888 [Alphaproteobacteria bacterium]|jgi:hypothetical protein|nr:hypothetical protein [Alphaproteobacteria bacterium]MEA2969850.1 hypothetical protein [Alphaproteobacteria bacterium]